MADYSATGNDCTIGHIVQFTGLTDRTIRSYIASGILVGEKINGLWHFTSEQVDAFMRHPAVQPSIRAKRNAIVHDFMLDNDKRMPQCCLILDLPGEDLAQISDFFCDAIRESALHDFRFSFDSLNGAPRVILKGRFDEVITLIDQFRSR